MKVLMTCDAVGGVWQYATDLASALARQGVDVMLAVLGPSSLSPSGERVASAAKPGEGKCDSPAASHCPSPGFAFGSATLPPSGEREYAVIHTDLPLDWLAAGPQEVLAAGRAIAALAAEHRVDLVHLNTPALAAGQPFAYPVVAVAHGCIGTWFQALDEAPGPDLAWHADLMRDGLRAADAVAAPSASFAAALTRRYDLAERPRVIHNGRRASDAGAPAQAADHVLTAGRLWDRAKNIALLDAAAALLSVPLRAAGPVGGPNGEAIRTGHLQLLGTLAADALAAEYAQRPIFVSAARFEPFGLAVLEAAQAGCPLVLSSIDTFRELWTGAALLVPENDPAAFAAAIQRVRGDAALRAHLSEQARIRAGRYTLDAMTSGTLAVYRALLPAAGRRAA